MTDRFYTTRNCDRCGESLEGKARKMSWFTEDCLCPDCINKEKVLRNELSKNGINVANLEGCGYMPSPDGEK